MEPSVAIILLNWNNEQDTIECLRSLKKIEYPNYGVIVVDNGSAEASVAAIRGAHPGTEVVENGRNLGFAAGNNVAIKMALQRGFDYVLLLNNDTVVDPKFLSELVRVGESDPNIGVLGPKIYYYSEPKRIWFAGGAINYWTGRLYHIGFRENDVGKYDTIRDVDTVTGCALMAKRRVYEDVGLLYEAMFAYFEDSDFSVRAHKKGYRNVYVPTSIVWHKISSTAKKLKDFQAYYNLRNWLIFMKRNAGPVHLAVFLPFYAIRYLGYNVTVALLQLKFSEAKLYLKATYDGLAR